MKLFRFLFTIYALIVFVILMLVVFPFVVLSMTAGPVKGGNLIYRLCVLWGDAWFFLVFIFVKRIYESTPDSSGPSIFVANHISYMDTPMVVKAFRNPLRPLGKAEISRVPVFGYIYRNAIVTVDRSSPENRSHSLRRLKEFLHGGISILVFPEGTFNTTFRPLKEMYNGAFRLAIETGTPIRPVLFLDTFDRMPFTGFFTLNPGISRVVYLQEVPVDGFGPEDEALLKQKVYNIMEDRLIKYRASWIRD